ncbi:MAG: AraC-like DNA-binding protein [Planctomycetota bacterium]|jgi:AraC-like DNA-binding protein
MIDRDVLNCVDNENLTQEDIAYLLDKLCSMGIKSGKKVGPKVIIFLKSKTDLGHVNREEVSKYMNMSSRTLSRKLKKENTGFHKLLDEERKRRCLNYLSRNMVCGQNIVELLGLSDISHFYRSFKRWTGLSFSEAKSMLAENNRNIDTIVHRHKLESGR